jgi:hypothetical protein
VLKGGSNMSMEQITAPGTPTIIIINYIKGDKYVKHVTCTGKTMHSKFPSEYL